MTKPKPNWRKKVEALEQELSDWKNDCIAAEKQTNHYQSEFIRTNDLLTRKLVIIEAQAKEIDRLRQDHQRACDILAARPTVEKIVEKTVEVKSKWHSQYYWLEGYKEAGQDILRKI